MNTEKLDELYALIDGCKCCELGCLPMNSGRRLRLKRGTRPILVVGQNPWRRVVPECDHVWGGLDLLLRRRACPATLLDVACVINSVWITNVVKCKTPKNHPLSAQQIKNCRKWLDAELSAIKPDRIVALGNFAQTQLGESYRGKPVKAHCHPRAAMTLEPKAFELYVRKLKDEL